MNSDGGATRVWLARQEKDGVKVVLVTHADTLARCLAEGWTITEPAPPPAVSPVVEPVVETAIEPVAEPVVEPTAKPASRAVKRPAKPVMRGAPRHGRS